ncbi:autotransporter domain-containing protein [Pollutimonas harenae]|uniref:Autotransporter domain-containing protein n=1 Tax=Pollutimonas harenae TaxID=657015 RepID=A0A853GZY2_9BURK|nr:autotransporter domain-containing protein [Pollutimonas harenae]NYT84989.1 autotransporter domain-containing protein [Pollutimonas harenae]TEA72621.1 autotransporter domain-containing protein [Pollutimonas harenae]
MNKIYCNVWSKVRNAMVVASELARGAGKGKNARAQILLRPVLLSAAMLVVMLGIGVAQGATVDVDGTAATLNATDTYTKITAINGGTVDADGNAVTISGNDVDSEGSAVVVLKSGAQFVLDGGGTLDNTNMLADSSGIDARGTDTRATLNGVAISTKGESSVALRVWQGAEMSVTDGTVLTEGDGGEGYVVFGGGTVEITRGTITTQGKSARGVLANEDSTVTLEDGVVIEIQGESSTGLFASGQSAIDMSGGSITTFERAGMGVEADQNATIKLTDGVKVTTDGDQANGIHAHNNSHVTLNDAVISSAGTFASGLFAYDAAALTMSGGSITTQERASGGVKAQGIAQVQLSSNVAISTMGEMAHGITTADDATVSMSGGSITTAGGQAHGVHAIDDADVALTDGVAIHTVGDSASGIFFTNGSKDVSMAGGSITTGGKDAHGISAVGNAGKIMLTNNVAITTMGENSSGLYSASGSRSSMSGGSITTSGGAAVGILAMRSQIALIDGVVIKTDGESAHGIDARPDTQFSMIGGSIATTGDTAVGISTTGPGLGGGISPNVTLDDVAITTSGKSSYGVSLVGDSQLDMTGGSVIVAGTEAHGVQATGRATAVLKDVTITASNTRASGVRVLSEAKVDMVGGQINVQGMSSYGVDAQSDANVKLTDAVAIMTSGQYGNGIGALDNASVTMAGGTVSTAGGGAFGIWAEGQSTLVVSDVSLLTTGDDATGVRASEDGRVTMTGVSLSTTGDGAAGVHAMGNASVTMSGGSVAIQGAFGYDGVNAVDAASVVLSDGVTISTANDFAVGISSMNDSTVTMTGGSISTAGILAAGTMSDSNSTVTLNGVAITTVGDSAYGALVNDSAQLTLNDTSVTTSGADATGVIAVQLAQLALNNVSITTTGANAMGLSVENDASAHLNQVTMDTVGASIGRNLYSSGLTPQRIIIANSTLTQNNGVLLEVTGSNLTDPTILQLTDGTVAMGDITDVSTTNRNTLALASGAQWTGVARVDGNLTLTDTGTATHGGTAAAPIQVSGDVTVNNGAALGGNLNVGGMLSGSSGALRPGNSIGTQTFASAGSFTGDYHAEVNAAGQSDLITVTSGNFDLTGINLYVDEADGNGGYKLDHDYTIVATGDASGISGVANNEFANGGELEGNLAASLVKLDPVIYGDDVVKIRLSVDEAKQLTLTHNQNAVVEAAQANPAVQKAVQMANYADALDHLSGEIHASTQTALLDTGNLMQRTLVNRMRGNSGSPSCANAAGLDQDRVDNAAACGLDYPLWAQVVGSWNHHDGDDNTASTRYRLGGLYLGGDKTFDNGWRIGGAVGFTDGKIDADDRDSKADVKSYTAALYGGKGWTLSKGQLNMLVGAGYTYHDIDTDRHTDVLGSQSLSAGYHANSTQLFAELGYALPVSDAAYVEPYLNLGWTDLRTEGFSESGGSTALQADSDHNQIFTQTLGLRGGTAITAGKTDISLLAGLGWRHASGDLDATRTMAFSQGGGERFEIKGAPIAKNAAVLDLGAEARLGENTALGLSYSGQFSSRGNDNTASLYLRMKF